MVELIGSSTDPDGDDDILNYVWEGDFDQQEGDTALIELPPGSYCIKLTVEDKVGHRDVKWVNVEVDCGVQNITLRSQTVNTELDFSIHPNPASQEIFISVGNGIVINQVNMYNQVGQRVVHEKSLRDVIDVSALPQGFYIVELVSNKSKARKSVLVF